MGRRNYLIEGLSGTGKTSVCDELQRRGYHAIHGDRELAYQGDPETGEPRDGSAHEHHIWNVDEVRALVADGSKPVTFLLWVAREVNLAGMRVLGSGHVPSDWRFELSRSIASSMRGPARRWSGSSRRRAVRRNASGRETKTDGGIRVEQPVEHVDAARCYQRGPVGFASNL